jgi:hypothetical protein
MEGKYRGKCPRVADRDYVALFTVYIVLSCSVNYRYIYTENVQEWQEMIYSDVHFVGAEQECAKGSALMLRVYFIIMILLPRGKHRDEVREDKWKDDLVATVLYISPSFWLIVASNTAGSAVGERLARLRSRCDRCSRKDFDRTRPRARPSPLLFRFSALKVRGHIRVSLRISSLHDITGKMSCHSNSIMGSGIFCGIGPDSKASGGTGLQELNPFFKKSSKALVAGPVITSKLLLLLLLLLLLMLLLLELHMLFIELHGDRR